VKNIIQQFQLQSIGADHREGVKKEFGDFLIENIFEPWVCPRTFVHDNMTRVIDKMAEVMPLMAISDHKRRHTWIGRPRPEAVRCRDGRRSCEIGTLPFFGTAILIRQKQNQNVHGSMSMPGTDGI